MLHQGNKIIISIFIIIFFLGCNNKNKYKEYNSEEIKNIRDLTISMSQSVVDSSIYWQIYGEMNDSIHLWIKNRLRWFEYYDGQRELIIDSTFCINKAGDKLVSAILKRCLDDCVQDDICFFYGVKIKTQWYFFTGPTLVLPREYYQKNIHIPLSFEKLKQIATSNIYRGYLKKNKLGEWEINDNFFSDLTSVAWCGDCVTQEQWDAAYMRQVQRNWTQK